MRRKFASLCSLQQLLLLTRKEVNLDDIQFALHCTKSPFHLPTFAAILQFLNKRDGPNSSRAPRPDWVWYPFYVRISPLNSLFRSRDALFPLSLPQVSPFARSASFQIFLQLIPESCLTTNFAEFVKPRDNLRWVDLMAFVLRKKCNKFISQTRYPKLDTSPLPEAPLSVSGLAARRRGDRGAPQPAAPSPARGCSSHRPHAGTWRRPQQRADWGRRCAASRSWVGEPAGDIPAAASHFPAWSATGAARAAVRSSALAPPSAPAACSRARQAPWLRSPRGECGVSAGRWVRKLEPNFSWARGEMGGGRETPRAGCREQSEGGTWARHTGSRIRVWETGGAWQASLRLGWGWGVRKFPHHGLRCGGQRPLPTKGRGRRVHLRPPCERPRRP